MIGDTGTTAPLADAATGVEFEVPLIPPPPESVPLVFDGARGPIAVAVDDEEFPPAEPPEPVNVAATLPGASKMPLAMMSPFAPLALMATVSFPFVTVMVPSFAQSTPPNWPSPGACCWFAWYVPSFVKPS